MWASTMEWKCLLRRILCAVSMIRQSDTILTKAESNYYYYSGQNLGSVCALKTQNLSTLSWKTTFTKGWWHVYPGSYTFFFSLWHHGGCQRPFLFLWHEPVDFIMKIFFYKRLMTCIPRFLHNFFQPLTSWRLSEAISVSMVSRWLCDSYCHIVAY